MSVRTSESTIDLSSLVVSDLGLTASASASEQETLVLFDRFRSPLLRYVCAFGISVGDGEDLIQDVFLALFRHLRRGGSRSNLPGWLFRVAHNLALQRRTERRREQARTAADIRTAQGIGDGRPDPEAQLADCQRRTRLVAVLNALPARDRQCLCLRGEGLRYREIARILGISLGSVAKSMARSIARLQRVDEG